MTNKKFILKKQEGQNKKPHTNYTVIDVKKINCPTGRTLIDFRFWTSKHSLTDFRDLEIQELLDFRIVSHH